jgi:hypothetical protein
VEEAPRIIHRHRRMLKLIFKTALKHQIVQILLIRTHQKDKTKHLMDHILTIKISLVYIIKEPLLKLVLKSYQLEMVKVIFNRLAMEMQWA